MWAETFPPPINSHRTKNSPGRWRNSGKSGSAPAKSRPTGDRPENCRDFNFWFKANPSSLWPNLNFFGFSNPESTGKSYIYTFFIVNANFQMNFFSGRRVTNRGLPAALFSTACGNFVNFRQALAQRGFVFSGQENWKMEYVNFKLSYRICFNGFLDSIDFSSIYANGISVYNRDKCNVRRWNICQWALKWKRKCAVYIEKFTGFFKKT